MQQGKGEAGLECSHRGSAEALAAFGGDIQRQLRVRVTIGFHLWQVTVSLLFTWAIFKGSIIIWRTKKYSRTDSIEIGQHSHSKWGYSIVHELPLNKADVILITEHDLESFNERKLIEEKKPL